MLLTTVGDFELVALSDGLTWVDGGAFFGVVPKTMWEKRLTPDDHNRVQSRLNSVLIRTGEKNVLVDTGMGNKLSEKMIQLFQQPAELLKSLSAAHTSPEDIDIVINTHLHFDHCGWNTVFRNGKLVPTFPKATYFVQQGEWQHAHAQERDSASYLHDNYDPLISGGQMKLLITDAQIVPGISVRVFPGHTRAMQAVVIQSQGKTACCISDLIPTRAHLDLNWVAAFDLYPLEAIESRKQYYSRAVPEKWLTNFSHDHTLPWAYIRKDERGKMTVEDLDRQSADCASAEKLAANSRQ
jgi:glyoxylase-like metal-dependent hydrolase (beta-lactamase superfamily II)